MNEEETKCIKEVYGRSPLLSMGPGILNITNPQKLLDIAKSIQAFIDTNGWSWCDMDRVYKILKTVNG